MMHCWLALALTPFARARAAMFDPFADLGYGRSGIGSGAGLR
jgi:hypothetical protein